MTVGIRSFLKTLKVSWCLPGTRTSSGCGEFGQAHQLYACRQPQKLHRANAPPVEVDFVPGKSMPRGSWVCMMVVVPSFTKGQERYPPVVGRIIARSKPAPAPHVRRRVNQPGRVKVEGDAEEYGPQDKWPAAQREQPNGEENDWQ